MPLHEVPYGTDGNVLDGVYRWMGHDDYEMRPNAPFESVLTFIQDGYGASNPKFYFEAEDGRQFPMFYSEFIRLFEAEAFEGTKTKRLTWQVAKRGSAYGIVATNA